ncbi:Uncharacterised protein [Mycobacteroides abscessus subsp. massiliense]|nr:Uncharacterised protein [Mycobacteroides abscessus subsp. massiliense]
MARHTAHAQQDDGNHKHDDVHRQQSDPEMDFAVFHSIAQEGQTILVNQKQTDGNQDIVGMAATRIEIGKRHGKQAQQ